MGLVGWEQNYDSSGTQLDAALIASSSGRMYNDEDPLLNIDNLLSTAPDYIRTAADQTAANVQFNQWVTKKTQAGIAKGISMWAQKKLMDISTRSLLERTELFDRTSSDEHLDTNLGKYVGFHIIRPKSRCTKFSVLQIGLQMTEAQELDIYLHRADKRDEYLKTTTLNYTDAGNLQWFDLDDWELEGAVNYFIGYKQSDLVGQTINGAINYRIGAGLTQWPQAKLFHFVAFSVDEPLDTELWHISDMVHTVSTNYGINARVSFCCDLTDFILEQKAQFKEVISKSVAIEFMQSFASNPNARTTRHGTNMSREEVLFQIHGDPRGRKTGLQYDLEKAIEAVLFDTHDIDPLCLPCRHSMYELQST